MIKIYVNPFARTVKSVIHYLDDFEWCVILQNHGNWTWKGFYNVEKKWNVITWSTIYWFWEWIFRKREFIEPSLIESKWNGFLQNRTEVKCDFTWNHQNYGNWWWTGFHNAQCGNYGNLLLRIFGKSFVKVTVLLNKLLLKELIWRNIFWWERIYRFSTMFVYTKNISWNQFLLWFTLTKSDFT